MARRWRFRFYHRQVVGEGKKWRRGECGRDEEGITKTFWDFPQQNTVKNNDGMFLLYLYHKC